MITLLITESVRLEIPSQKVVSVARDLNVMLINFPIIVDTCSICISLKYLSSSVERKLTSLDICTIILFFK